MSALGTVLGLGVALPFALAAPAHAQSNLSVAKSHEGNFARGEQGVYTITLTSTGVTGILDVTDNLPAGVTATALGGLLGPFCDITNGGTTVHCGDGLNFIGALSAPLDVTVDIAADAPCSVTNTVTVIETESEEQGGETFTHSASDPTTITGGDCDGGDGGGGGSILPINLNGVIPMFNNITTNSNIGSPGASNNSHQVFGLNAP
ncbi:hypothetical protein [Streptomyces sp. NBC_01167]|uniref:hypothetical protein n=1 Tax=unclassified Streptomyces TaxID=2593676 RepID=UPI00386FD65B|nr:hypothetical protein OG317_11875 [Streptomyces sp. NBC_01167]